MAPHTNNSHSLGLQISVDVAVQAQPTGSTYLDCSVTFSKLALVYDRRAKCIS